MFGVGCSLFFALMHLLSVSNYCLRAPSLLELCCNLEPSDQDFFASSEKCSVFCACRAVLSARFPFPLRREGVHTETCCPL